jgi:tetratricopeptide (TPR) repeat protein
MEEDAFLFFRKMKTKYEKNKEDLSIMYQAMGEALNELDLFDASISVIDEAISILGPDVDFYWLKLQSCFSLEDNEEVLEIAAQIEQINPLDAENWCRLGEIYTDLNEIEKAIEAFEFAESLGYKKQTNYLNLIAVYEKNGNYLKALEKAKEYLYLYPENYIIDILAANICAGMEMWEEALFYVDAALEIVPEMDALYLYKSSFFLNLGEQRKAISALEEGIRQTSDMEGDLKKELERLQNQYPK